MTDFAAVKKLNASVQDGQGRTVNWSTLRSKTIYLTGHGCHVFRHGYCTIPSDTTIHFYNPYGRLFTQGQYVMDEIIGGKTTPDRSVREGQSCPNMTLIQDDDECIGETEIAIGKRIAKEGASDDHFNFNCNQFSGLEKFVPVARTLLPGQSPPVNGKPTWQQIHHNKPCLKLEEILQLVAGNTLHWLCCQELSDQVHVEVKNTSNLPMGLAEFEQLKPLELFTETVQSALYAANNVAGHLVQNNNIRGGASTKVGHQDGTFDNGVQRNIASARYTTKTNNEKVAFHLQTTGGRISLALDDARRGIDADYDRKKVRECRLQIQAGIDDLRTVRLDPFKAEDALRFLERNLMRADNLLKAWAQLR